MTPLSLYFSLPKMIKLCLMGIFILLIGVNCFTADIYSLKIIGLFQIALGVAVFLVAIKSMLDKKPQIIMDETGIIDNRILKTTISWNQIQDFELQIKNNQKVLKLIIPNTFKEEHFKWLYRQTAKMKLKEKPKNILLNLDQLKINYESLNAFLSSKDEDYVPENLNKNLNSFGRFINRMLY